MSLTSKLKGKDKKFKEIMKSSVPSKNMFNTLSGKNAFSNQYILKAPSNLSSPYYSSVVGIAFDYLVRIISARIINENKEGSYRNLVAKSGLAILDEPNSKIYLKLQNKYEKSIEKINKFIFSKSQFVYNESNLEEIIYISCYYARLEQIYRSKILPKNIKTVLLDKEEKEIVDDLKNIYNVFEDVFIKSGIINEKSKIIFNPKFGLSSLRMGGADADIFIDGTLYDFKTSVNKGYRWGEIAQIWGYYILNLIESSIDDSLADLSNCTIERIAIYRARYGEIEYIDTEMIENNVKVDTTCKIKQYLVINKD